MFLIIGYEIYVESGSKIFMLASGFFTTFILIASITHNIKKSKQKKHFGPIELHYSSFPINLGSEVSYSIRFQKSVHLKEVNMLAQCVEEYYRRNGDNGGYYTRTLFSKEVAIPAEELTQSSAIHFKLEIPNDPNLKTHIKNRDSKFWEIGIVGKNTKGVEFDEKYLVPIY